MLLHPRLLFPRLLPPLLLSPYPPDPILLRTRLCSCTLPGTESEYAATALRGTEGGYVATHTLRAVRY
eukprot:1040061-Rhodomonas_salina.3